ncbi:complex I intermediate-associated protein 30, mitochondrial-like [Anneissia japonica]|uniref:complex I intermediate-associated protein 30, mitochondrial-like n=1 Tax=Anneissia japonica TaxID=1529436 RepID=UPI001425B6B7|nr:complex I intermediate-associated protein 30, mitochondrial-like [Anneissia japonica]XP_033104956.1 complex I intermediate-associated protein 30, mitochondrial-like [Anneissia japonica]
MQVFSKSRLYVVFGKHILKKVPCKAIRPLSSDVREESVINYWKRNFRLFRGEIYDKLRGSKLDTMYDTHKVIMSCDTNIVNKFNIQTDNAIGGKSWAKLCMSRNNRLLFHGELSTVVPKDGETERSGYCALKSKQLYGAFEKKIQIDLSPFNVLKFRIRGDGRSYMVNFYADSYYSDTQDDIWSYFLFTRGGPHWQEATVPFSKFFLSSRGRIQDRQELVDLENINCFGLTMADAVDGEFALEIDIIAATYDPTHTEEFAYEMYNAKY